MTNGVTQVCCVLAASGAGTIALEDPGWPRLREVAVEAGLALAPALQLRWAVTPPRWTRCCGRDPDPGPPVLDQLALARFIRSSAYDRTCGRSAGATGSDGTGWFRPSAGTCRTVRSPALAAAVHEAGDG